MKDENTEKKIWKGKKRIRCEMKKTLQIIAHNQNPISIIAEQVSAM